MIHTHPYLPGLDEPAPKAFRQGTHRLMPPAETVARVRRFMPVMGITRIANITGLDCIGIPIGMVCRPNARSLSVAQGKGLDLAAAQASGLMESVESYHAEHLTLPLKLATYEELRYTHQVVDPTQLPRPAGGLFHPHLVLPWIAGYDLLRDAPVWVPYEMVHLNYTVAMRQSTPAFFASSNGLASGNHLLEAISHAICEVVERDATTLWYLSDPTAQAATRIDPATVDDPACRVVLDKFARAGIAVGIWEITSDIGLPAFLCRIVDAADEPLRRLCNGDGMGCHPAREVALLRALTEAAQSRVTWIAGSRDDCYPAHYARLRDPAMLQRRRAEITAPEPGRPFTAAPTRQTETCAADVAWELACLRTAGITRVVVVDLTKPEFRLPVVRVVIPGLESLAGTASYVPGARARAAAGRPV
jgi:YcaO-like protein with predicted kinase domain